MKPITALLLALALCLAMTGCHRTENTDTTPPDTNTPTATSPLEGKSLTEIVDLIYAKHPMELSLMTVEVDLTDEYAVKSYLGLDSAEGIAEAVASESAFGSQAYSLVLCRVSDPAQTQSIARQMHKGIDQRKWICVMADDLMVSAYQDLVLLVMIGSEYEDSATAQQLTEAFTQVCGCRPELTLDD
jgi:hypothetical protein